MRQLRQLASESLVYGFSTALSKLAYVILVPLYTRVFTAGEYGVVALVTTIGAAATVLVVLGLDSAAHRWFWDTEDTADRKRTLASWVWCQLGSSVVVAAVMIAAAGPLARAVTEAPGADTYFRLLGASLPLTAMGMVTTNWLRMQRRAWATLFFNLAVVASSLALTVGLVIGLRWGIAGIFWAQLLTGIWSGALAVAVMRDWLHPRHASLARLREMLAFALPLIPAGLAVWVLGLGDRLFLQRYAATADVGIYQVGYAVASVVALGTQAFQQAWGPFSFSISRNADARQVYASALPAYLWVTCLAAAGVGALGPEILALVATPAYAGAKIVTPLLAFSFVMVGLGYIAGLGLGLARKTAPLGIAVTMAAVLNLGLNLVLTPRMGMEGAALSALVAQATVPAYLFYRAQREYPIPYRFGQALAILALAGGVTWAGAAWSAGSGAVTVGGKLVLLSLFFPALFALGIVPRAQAAAVLRRLRPRLAR